MFSMDDEGLDLGEGLEPTASSLAHWIEDQYLGDERFAGIEVLEPGPLEGEAARAIFICNDETHFFVAVLEEESVVRVGLAIEDRELSEAIETTVSETGDSLTEFLEIAMNADDELEYEMRHYHDDVYYFCSDIPYTHSEQFTSNLLRDEIIYYLDGYINALYENIDL